jgi:hypothetical protein
MLLHRFSESRDKCRKEGNQSDLQSMIDERELEHEQRVKVPQITEDGVGHGHVDFEER